MNVKFLKVRFLVLSCWELYQDCSERPNKPKNFPFDQMKLAFAYQDLFQSSCLLEMATKCRSMHHQTDKFIDEFWSWQESGGEWNSSSPFQFHFSLWVLLQAGFSAKLSAVWGIKGQMIGSLSTNLEQKMRLLLDLRHFTHDQWWWDKLAALNSDSLSSKWLDTCVERLESSNLDFHIRWLIPNARNLDTFPPRIG